MNDIKKLKNEVINEQSRNRASRIERNTHSAFRQSLSYIKFCFVFKNQPVKERPLGLLKGKVEFAIDENFNITGEDLFKC